jgi:hypothetical protein
VLSRLGVICLILAASIADATAGVEIHATCATELARETVHVRTLRDEVARALAGTRVAARYTLDVSLVALTSTPRGSEVETKAEVRALLSDEHGRARWQTTSRATVRGPAQDRVAIQRDAVIAAAHDLARGVRSAAR